jgi:hypothetical protein
MTDGLRLAASSRFVLLIPRRRVSRLSRRSHDVCFPECLFANSAGDGLGSSRQIFAQCASVVCQRFGIKTALNHRSCLISGRFRAGVPRFAPLARNRGCRARSSRDAKRVIAPAEFPSQESTLARAANRKRRANSRSAADLSSGLIRTGS